MTFGGRIITEILGGIINAANDPETGQILRDSLTTIANEIFDFFKNKDWISLGKGILKAIWAGLKGENYDFQSVFADWMGTDSETVDSIVDTLASTDSKKRNEAIKEAKEALEPDSSGGRTREYDDESWILSQLETYQRQLAAENLPSPSITAAFRSAGNSLMAANTPVSFAGGAFSSATAPTGTVNNMYVNVEPGANMTEFEAEATAVMIADKSNVFNYGR